jgi:hypothetical protein
MISAPSTTFTTEPNGLDEAVERAIDDAEHRIEARRRFVEDVWPELATATAEVFEVTAAAVRRRGHRAEASADEEAHRIRIAVSGAGAPETAPAAVLCIEALPAVQRIRVRWSVPHQIDDESAYAPGHQGRDVVEEAVRRWLPDALYWTSPVVIDADSHSTGTD